jgi:8-oxo-dGTP pyrophosphatase MutT (NUDIX family)
MKEKIRRILRHRGEKFIRNENLSPAAVLIPIYEKAGGHYLIFTQRTEKVNYHKGQISFPGGAYQREDGTLKVTALRESSEEIGLDPKDAEVLGELDDIVTITSNYIISPFVAAIPYPYEFKLNEDEVEEIINVPVAALLDKSNFREEHQFLQGQPFTTYFYEYDGHIIYGATAQILNQLLDLVFKGG